MNTVNYTDVKEAIKRVASEEWGIISKVINLSDLESNGAYYAALNKEDFKHLSKDQLYIIGLTIEYIFGQYPELVTNDEKDTLLNGLSIIQSLRVMRKDKRLRVATN